MCYKIHWDTYLAGIPRGWPPNREADVWIFLWVHRASWAAPGASSRDKIIVFDVPTTQSEGHFSGMRTSLLWTKFLFSDKIEKYFFSACYDQINQVGRDPVRWGQFSATLYIKVLYEVNNFSTPTVESNPRPVRALNCSLNYTLPISNDVVKCQTFNRKGGLKQFHWK